MALDTSEILRNTQIYSAPTRRALSTGLDKTLLETRYYDNPNVAALVTRQALRGYGEGLSSAVSSGYQSALSTELAEEGLDISREQLGLQREQIESMEDAYTVMGLTQLGLLANELTGGAISDILGKGVKSIFGGGSTASSMSALTGGSTSGLVSGSNVASLTNDLAIAGVTGTPLTTGEVALTTGAPATVSADAAYTAASGAGTGTATATGSTTGLTGGAALGTIAAATLAAPVLGPALTSGFESLSESLGMGKQTAPGAAEYLNAYLSGTEAGTDLGYGQSMPGSSWWSKASNVKSLLSNLEPGYTPSNQLVRQVMSGKYKDINQIRNALKFSGAGTYTDPTAH